MLFAIPVILVSLFMIALSFRAIYFAFIKKKDERSKWIVTKSMADSFVANIILQTILYVIKLLNYNNYEVWWNNFKEGIYIDPVLLSFIILGIILIVNTKRHGGSL